MSWVTIKGRHVFIKDGENPVNALMNDLIRNGGGKSNYKKQHEEAIEELKKDKYEDGTYNLDTMKQIEYDDGYQVTFCQIGDNYNDAEYEQKVNEFLNATDDKIVSAGKFESTPEISFNVKSKDEAIKLAKKYNQISVWDWKECKEIKTGGSGRR